jgi:hypothetical protein
MVPCQRKREMTTEIPWAYQNTTTGGDVSTGSQHVTKKHHVQCRANLGLRQRALTLANGELGYSLDYLLR